MNFSEAIFFFLCYACLGWCVEVAFAAMKNGRFVNRGFLNGPWCPIYGFGATLVIGLLMPLQHRLPALFIGSCIIATLLEYFTGTALEKLFHTRWWDYSEMPFNIGGHVCLLFSVIWGLACTFVVRIIHPLFAALQGVIPLPLLIGVLSILLIDAVATVLTMRKLSVRLQQIDRLAADLRRISDELGENIYETVSSIEEHAEGARDWWDESVRPRLETLDDAADRQREQWNERWEDWTEDLRSRIDGIEDSFAAKRERYRWEIRLLADAMRRTAAEKRMLNAYPHLKAVRNPQALERLKAYHQRKKTER